MCFKYGSPQDANRVTLSATLWHSTAKRLAMNYQPIYVNMVKSIVREYPMTSLFCIFVNFFYLSP